MVSPYPAGDHNASKNTQVNRIKANVKHKQQKRSTKEAPPWNVIKQIHWSLRILVTNFQSVRKKGKHIDVLVESRRPDITFDTETWLSGDILSSYFFNP